MYKDFDFGVQIRGRPQHFFVQRKNIVRSNQTCLKHRLSCVANHFRRFIANSKKIFYHVEIFFSGKDAFYITPIEFSTAVISSSKFLILLRKVLFCHLQKTLYFQPPPAVHWGARRLEGKVWN